MVSPTLRRGRQSSTDQGAIRSGRTRLDHHLPRHRGALPGSTRVVGLECVVFGIPVVHCTDVCVQPVSSLLRSLSAAPACSSLSHCEFIRLLSLAPSNMVCGLVDWDSDSGETATPFPLGLSWAVLASLVSCGLVRPSCVLCVPLAHPVRLQHWEPSWPRQSPQTPKWNASAPSTPKNP